MIVMGTRLSIILGFSLLALQPTLAACPTPAAGSTAEEIRANGQRILCLQQELGENAEQRKLQMDFDALNRRVQDLQLQRQLDVLPKFEPFVNSPGLK